MAHEDSANSAWLGAQSPELHEFAGSLASIAYYTWGDPAGRPVLLMHGTGFHARTFDETIAFLPMNVRIIAVDLRGHGKSSTPGPIDQLKSFVDDLIELIEHLDLIDGLGVGHSLGGHCMASLAARTNRLSQLLLIDPAIAWRADLQQARLLDWESAASHPASRRRAQWGSVEEFFAHLERRRPYSLWDRKVLRDYCEFGLREVEGGFELACTPLFEASVYLTAGEQSIYDELPRIKVPTRIIRAPYTGLKPGEMINFEASLTAPDLSKMISDCEEVDLPNLTHFIPMQRPDLVATHIRDLLG